jgi:hypothetical protein
MIASTIANDSTTRAPVFNPAIFIWGGFGSNRAEQVRDRS